MALSQRGSVQSLNQSKNPVASGEAVPVKISPFLHIIGSLSPLIRESLCKIKVEGFKSFLSHSLKYIKKNKDIVTLRLLKNNYESWVEKNSLKRSDTVKILEEIQGLSYKPKISIIIPLQSVEELWLEKSINSLRAQLYENWELCIAGDASLKPLIRETLQKYSCMDERITIECPVNISGISAATNAALSLAEGEFIGLLDVGDELSIDALFEVVSILNINPKADLIYSDEDKIDINGKRSEPFFKPDYSPDMLESMNYICHFSVFRRSIVNEIGGFRTSYEGSQDYDLTLRFIEKTTPEGIVHVPKILYHWRKVPSSATVVPSAKIHAHVSACKALQDYLFRNDIDGEVLDGNFVGSYRVRRRILNKDKVSIIVPFRDKARVLARCVKSILDRSKYQNYEIVLLDNLSKEKSTFELLSKLARQPKCSILKYDNSFNFSAITNYAVNYVSTEYIVFLNNDIEVITPDWIENMLEYAQRDEVGAVGALLYYPHERIQHGGIIIGLGGTVGHSHRHVSRRSLGYFGRAKVVQNLSAVTAACMMTKKRVFHEVDGFDEYLKYDFNDVDFCLKLRDRGYLIVFTPFAELYHHESLSRGYKDTKEKVNRFKKETRYFEQRWKDVLRKGDPYYNRNLRLEREDFSIRTD